MNKLRWLLVIPSAFIGWYIAIFLGVITIGIIDSLGIFSNCSHKSPLCSVILIKPIFSILTGIFASLSGITTMLCPYFMAPNHRPLIAKITFLGGACFAIRFAILDKTLLIPSLAAILFALITLLLLTKYWGNKNAA